ncbi:MAG: glycosyltransferase family 87 protein [Anaerolineales bacterium]
MKPFWTDLQEEWHTRRWFRVLLTIAAAWSLARLGLQASVLFSGNENQAAIDLQVYLDASRHFIEGAALYPTSLEILEYHFPYPPIFACLFAPFLWLPAQVNIALQLLLHIAAYIALFAAWRRIFAFCELDHANRMLILTLPVWLVFSPFWDDLGYLNIYTIMALLGTLLIEAILKQNLAQAILWLTFILVTKPQWAFAAAIPLLFKHYRFFFKMLIGALLSYLILAGITALVGGSAYVVGQFREYIGLLARLGREFPYRGPESGFLGYNHSIKQIFAFMLGPSEAILRLATAIKVILLIPLGILCLRLFSKRDGNITPAVALEIALLLYLGAFIWLDVLWEAFLTIAIYAYLVSAADRKWTVVLSIFFLAYALLDPIRAILYVVGPPMIQDSYLPWDYSIYIPTTMLTILANYSWLLKQRWHD